MKKKYVQPIEQSSSEFNNTMMPRLEDANIEVHIHGKFEVRPLPKFDWEQACQQQSTWFEFDPFLTVFDKLILRKKISNYHSPNIWIP